LNEEATSLMKITEESAESLLALVNNVLDLSKIEAGKMEIEAEIFNLSDLVQECVRAMSIEAGKKSLEVTAEADQRIPSILQGDRLRTRQLLLNLIGNGVKFTDTGRITVAVYLAGTDSHTIHVRFDVKDTGIGISEQEQTLLFKPFSQIDSSSTRKHYGAGLGLYISKQLVEIMGGTISIESSKGNGTICSFTLPFKLPQEERLLLSQQTSKLCTTHL
jgi:signal transduction histidine kinase